MSEMAIDNNVTRHISRHWLMLGVFALALSGVFSIVVAVAWHPSVKAHSIFATLFHRSLVAHVNLSISLWFLCCLFALWGYVVRYNTRNSIIGALCDRAAWWCVAVGVVAMSISSMLPSAVPYMNNYVPMLEHPLFVLSLGVVFSAILLKLVQCALMWHGAQQHALRTACGATACIIALMLAAFVMSGAWLDRSLSGETRYEVLFWGGGHVMQFVWSGMALLCWALLMHYCYGLALGKVLSISCLINMVLAFSSILPYVIYDVESVFFRQMFTRFMIWFGAVGPIILALWFIGLLIARQCMRSVEWSNPALGNFWWSAILFAAGGIFSLLIDGINVKIPAHYHGSLVSVTMAAMGMAYYTLDGQGYRPVMQSRLAKIQPHLLGIGQIMHIGGLYVSGGYGVQRKTPNISSDAAEQLDMIFRIQSTGGGIAIIGGLLFVIVMWRAKCMQPVADKS